MLYIHFPTNVAAIVKKQAPLLQKIISYVTIYKLAPNSGIILGIRVLSLADKHLQSNAKTFSAIKKQQYKSYKKFHDINENVVNKAVGELIIIELC